MRLLSAVYVCTSSLTQLYISDMRETKMPNDELSERVVENAMLKVRFQLRNMQ